MSKRNSTQSITWTQKLLGRWAVLCVMSPQSVLTFCVLFSLAGFIATWLLWFPYSSPVSQLPKNFDERLVWEETSRRIQFNSDIMLRVSIPDSGRLSQPPRDHPLSSQSQSAEDRLTMAVEFLQDKLSGNKQHFCDVLSSLDLQHKSKRELYELPDDDLQMLYEELHDARLVLGGRWALLESASYADWLTSRLNQTQSEISKIVSQQGTGHTASSYIASSQPNLQAILIKNRRNLVSAVRFADGLRQNLTQPVSQQNHELITPWQLQPDMLLAIADNLAGNGQPDTIKPLREATVIVWVKLAEPQLSNLLDRRVIARQKKIDRRLIGKLNDSMEELFHIVEDARKQFDDIAIEPLGVPVDVYRRHTSPFPSRTTGVLVTLTMLTLLFIAGFDHVRLYFVILFATICSFGIYLGFCALWFEMVTPYDIFIGISVPLFGICAGTIQAATYLNACRRRHSASGAIVEMMQISGKTTLGGGLISVAVFLGAVFYLWNYPVEPTTATLSFRSSLVGINLTLFLLAQSVLASLVGHLAVLPTLMRIVNGGRESVTVPRPMMLDHREDSTLHKAQSAIPLSANVLLTFVLLGGFLFFLSRPNAVADRKDQYFATTSEKQAAIMPILVSQQWFLRTGWGDIPGLFVCDASRLVTRHDANKDVIIDNMSRIAGHTSPQQKIPLPDQRSLCNSLDKLYRQLAGQLIELQKLAASGNMKAALLQDDLRLCQTAGTYIVEARRLLEQIPQKEYGERIDAWQQAIANNLISQQRSLQSRLRDVSQPEMDPPPFLTKRFLGADQQPLVWLFPDENWQTIATHEKPLPVIDLLLIRESQLKMQPDHLLSARGGFPLLVLNGRQLMQQQLPVVGAVMLVALVLSIVVVSRSVPSGAMTVLTIIGGISLYGLVLLTLGIPFGKITLFPIAFFPLILPLFFDLLRPSDMSHDHFKASTGGTLICFGIGIVIVGHLIFSADAVLVMSGRVMTIGWVALMLPLFFNLSSIPQPENAGRSPITADPKPDHPTPQRPTSLATHDQLVLYRNRIEASHVFEKQLDYQEERTLSQSGRPHKGIADFHSASSASDNHRAAKPSANATSPDKTNLFDLDATSPQPEVPEQPIFPPVWSVGTKRRTSQMIVVEPAHEALLDSNKVVSLAPPSARLIVRKSQKLVLTAKMPQQSQYEMIESSTELPTILPMHRHGETTDESQMTSRRKFG